MGRVQDLHFRGDEPNREYIRNRSLELSFGISPLWGVSENRGYLILGVLITRILLFRVLY